MFQAQAFALVATHAVISQPLYWFDDIDDTPFAINLETGGPGDDLRVELTNGTQIEVEAKRGLKNDDRLKDAILRIAKA